MSAEAITAGRTSLGIELGSTRIKATLVGDGRAEVLASGSHTWENELVDGVWTYSPTAVREGLRAAYADLAADVQRRHDVLLDQVGAIGISAMMHGYLARDAAGDLLVPFRTWRNTSTARAAEILSEALAFNIPQRWSIAHLYQAVLDGEPHVSELASMTTLAGHVHAELTGERVLGVGDASGMFPIDVGTGTYDAAMVETVDHMLADRGMRQRVLDLLPTVLAAGEPAGRLTEVGAALLDATGVLRAGAPACPPEGDAGTGMVATSSLAPRSGNVSLGTSIFSMVVLEKPLAAVRTEIDVVATPAGAPVAMVHCNNGADELNVWARLFGRFAAAAGTPMTADQVFDTLLVEALGGEPDAGGVLVYNYAAGEPIASLDAGRPMLVRGPESDLSLANFMRAQVYGMLATLVLGMRILDGEGVRVDRMYAHGGVIRSNGIAQRFLAAALDTPVAVAATATSGGSWGIAVLANYLRERPAADLSTYVECTVFGSTEHALVTPDPVDRDGYVRYLERFEAGLAAERAAVASI